MPAPSEIDRLVARMLDGMRVSQSTNRGRPLQQFVGASETANLPQADELVSTTAKTPPYRFDDPDARFDLAEFS